MIELAVAIAERVVGKELTTSPSIVVDWAREGLATLGGDRVASLSVSPDVARALSEDDRSLVGVENRDRRIASRRLVRRVLRERARRRECVLAHARRHLGARKIMNTQSNTRSGTPARARDLGTPSSTIDFARRIALVKRAPAPAIEGRVHEVVGLLVEVEGMKPRPVGSQLAIDDANGRTLLLEVFGFRDGKLLAAPLGTTAGVEPGAWVRRIGDEPSIPCGEALLGRVIDAFGAPLDGKPAPQTFERAKLHASAPHALSRRAITTPLETRVRAIDALLPLGKGQRIGLFAGSGVGKSTLLGMMCRHTRADVIVVGLIGERGREVGDFVRATLGEAGLARSVVIAATGDQPPFVRARGAYAATAIAEYFRDQGLDVLLVMDSVTRFAMASRESSLAAGEPPVAKGYKPSVFAALPKLCSSARERRQVPARSPRSTRCSSKATISTIRSPTPCAEFWTVTSCCREKWQTAEFFRRSIC